ncbi:hypothetical protein ACFL35_11605, partial [Candidatus Riflebacteria bacterium]
SYRWFSGTSPCFFCCTAQTEKRALLLHTMVTTCPGQTKKPSPFWRYRYQETYPEDVRHFFLQQSVLDGRDTLKSRFFTGPDVYMDFFALWNSRGTKKPGKIKKRKNMLLFVAPRFDDPLHDSDGVEWLAMYSTLKHLGFSSMQTFLKGELIPSTEKKYLISESNLFAFEVLF